MGFPGELIKEETVLTGTKSSVEIEHNNKDCGKSNQREMGCHLITWSCLLAVKEKL